MRIQKEVWRKFVVYLGLLTLFLLPACNPDPCSTAFLISSINTANSTPATIDTINLAPGCTYELSTVDNTIDGNNGLPTITSPIVINGNGATIRRGLDAQKMALRLFHVSPNGNLTLNNVILFDGLGMNPPDLTLPIVNNGGAIFNAGQVLINNSTLDSNRAIVGGGIYNAATGVLTVESTSIINNEANIDDFPLERGGGIYNLGQASILNSTIADNFAWSAAGGIYNEGTLVISNSTISGNSTFAASGAGSAIQGDGVLAIEYSTITNNFGGASYAVFYNNIQSMVEISNTIIANNSNFDCFFSVPLTGLSGMNLDSDGTCSGFGITADPMLDPLTNNGGPTDTHALQSGSPALDAALNSCLPTDQRGVPRPQGSACDLGAFERDASALPDQIGVPSDTPTPESTPTPTATMTSTPEQLVCTYTALENTNCRASDYPESQLIAILMQGDTAELIGLNPMFTHGRFKLSTQEQCWIWLGLMDGPENPFDECGIPVLDPPPSPTATPTEECRLDLDQRTCIARGGEWSADADYCACPR